MGDKIQFSSLPENYFRATGHKLIDTHKCWIFDHNPFVLRDFKEPLSKTVDLWNFSPMQYDWPVPPAPRLPVYNSNAEIWCMHLGIPAVLTRPRLYIHEDWPFEKRRKILLHTDGRSHGKMPLEVIEHVRRKYLPTGDLYLVGLDVPSHHYGIPYIKTDTLWDLAKEISQARMFIGSDSGPAWIAACYHDVVVKKVRHRQMLDQYNSWTPLAVNNFHAHWDDRAFQIHVVDENDRGPFWSYKRL